MGSFFRRAGWIKFYLSQFSRESSRRRGYSARINRSARRVNRTAPWEGVPGGGANRLSPTRGPPPLARPVLTARGKKKRDCHSGPVQSAPRETPGGPAQDGGRAPSERGGTEPKRAAEVAVATANGCVITVAVAREGRCRDGGAVVTVTVRNLREGPRLSALE